MHAVRFGGFVRDAPRTTHHSNIATLTTYCSPLTAHCSHCSLLTAHCGYGYTYQYRQSYHTYHFLLTAHCSLWLWLRLPGARRACLPRGAATADEPRGELVQGAKGARVRYTPLPCASPIILLLPPPLTTLHRLSPRCAATSGTWLTVSPAGGSTTGSAARASILRDRVSTRAMSPPGSQLVQ